MIFNDRTEQVTRIMPNSNIIGDCMSTVLESENDPLSSQPGLHILAVITRNYSKPIIHIYISIV